jgi:hypothetical protein
LISYASVFGVTSIVRQVGAIIEIRQAIGAEEIEEVRAGDAEECARLTGGHFPSLVEANLKRLARQPF